MMQESQLPKKEHEHAFLVTAEKGEVQVFYLLGSMTTEQARELLKTLSGAIATAESRGNRIVRIDLRRVT
jgi:hypothetical protein